MSKQKSLDNVIPPSEANVLIDRNQARVILGDISYSKVLELEKEGKLSPRRLSDSPKAKVFLLHREVLALAGGTATDVLPFVPRIAKHAQKIPNTLFIDGRKFVEVIEQEA